MLRVENAMILDIWIKLDPPGVFVIINTLIIFYH